MQTVGESLQRMGYASDEHGDVILAWPVLKKDGSKIWMHARQFDVQDTAISDFTNLYVASGRFAPGSVKQHSGRREDNLVDVLDIPFDFDLAPYLGQPRGSLYDADEDYLAQCIEALASDVTDTMNALSIPIHMMIGTGYGVLALARIAPHERGRVRDIRALHPRLVRDINLRVHSEFADSGVKDAGTRIIRLVGSVNDKGNTPRPVTILYEGAGYLSLENYEFESEGKRGYTPACQDGGVLGIEQSVHDEIVAILGNGWTEGRRHGTALAVSALLGKAGVSRDEVKRIISDTAGSDREIRGRLNDVDTTFDRLESGKPVAGYTRIRDFVDPDAFLALEQIADRIYRERQGREYVYIRAGSSGEEPPDIVFPDEAWGPETSLFRRYFNLVRPTTSAAPSFHYAAIHTVVGSLVSRKLSTYYAERQYPVFHTVLVGESGSSKKDTAAKRAIDLFQHRINGEWDFPISYLTDVNSAEALIESLENRPALLFASEFASILHKGRQQATGNLVPQLLELWNCPPQKQLLTRSNPKVVHQPRLSIISGIPEEILAANMTRQDVESGLGNRLFLVYGVGEEEIADPPPPDEAESQKLVLEIRDTINDFPNGYVFPKSKGAQGAWDEWHAGFTKERSFTEVERQVTQRTPIHLHRLFITNALSRQEHVISEENVRETVAAGEALSQHAQRMVKKWGRVDEARLHEDILSALRDGPRHRVDFDVMFSGMVGPTQVGRTLDAMQKNGRVLITASGTVEAVIP